MSISTFQLSLLSVMPHPSCSQSLIGRGGSVSLAQIEQRASCFLSPETLEKELERGSGGTVTEAKALGPVNVTRLNYCTLDA